MNRSIGRYRPLLTQRIVTSWADLFLEVYRFVLNPKILIIEIQRNGLLVAFLNIREHFSAHVAYIWGSAGPDDKLIWIMTLILDLVLPQ